MFAYSKINIYIIIKIFNKFNAENVTTKIMMFNKNNKIIVYKIKMKL